MVDEPAEGDPERMSGERKPLVFVTSLSKAATPANQRVLPSFSVRSHLTSFFSSFNRNKHNHPNQSSSTPQNPLTMSFLCKATPFYRVAARSSIARSSPRLFTTAFVQQKTATDSVKDGLKAVDRAVSDAAVAGIDKGGELRPRSSP